MGKITKFIRKLGPGLITGASDDDPSGIVIYSQVGAVAGTALSWTALFTLPFMIAIQEMCARIGLVTGHGLIGTMKKEYPRVFLTLIALLAIIANTINIGADIAGMAASINIFVPISPTTISFIIAFIIIGFMIYFPYKILANIFKWLTLTLFAYIFTSLIVVDNWQRVVIDTLIPNIAFSRDHLLLIVAILGTTISPYLFFWQASEEAEEKREGTTKKQTTKREIKLMRQDVSSGMLFSNIIMFFIIVASARTLPELGITNIESADQAARALTPFAGQTATLLFTFGIVGTGMLAIPILAGSAAYAASEAFNWRGGLSLPWAKARAFYSVIVAATIVGFLLTTVGGEIGITPFRALFLTGIIYGVLSPVLILTILLIANNKRVLGDKVNGFWSNVLGAATFVIMTIALIALAISQ